MENIGSFYIFSLETLCLNTLKGASNLKLAVCIATKLNIGQAHTWFWSTGYIFCEILPNETVMAAEKISMEQWMSALPRDNTQTSYGNSVTTSLVQIWRSL